MENRENRENLKREYGKAPPPGLPDGGAFRTRGWPGMEKQRARKTRALCFLNSLSAVAFAAHCAAGTATAAASAAGVLSLLLLSDKITDNGDNNG